MNPELDVRWDRCKINLNCTGVTQISGCNQFISSQKLVLFTVQLMVLLGPLFMLYSYSYDISDHTSSPFFSRDCNGKESNAIPAVSGRSLEGGVERRRDEDSTRLFCLVKQQQPLLLVLFKNSSTYLHFFYVGLDGPERVFALKKDQSAG